MGKRYLAHGGIIWNSINRVENGGVSDISQVKDTVLQDIREVDVFLSSATNKYMKRTVFFDQSVRLPFSSSKTSGTGVTPTTCGRIP